MKKKLVSILLGVILLSSMIVQPIATMAENSSPTVSYRTHVQTYGWQDCVSNGTTSGTSGESKRLEAIQIKLDSSVSGGIQYRTHVQSYGWQEWVSDDKLSGTSGQAKRLEAIQIKLTGEMANKYDVYYRVHAQNFGWMDWAKNGESAGTSGYSYRLEAIQVVLVEKGGSAPGRTQIPYKQAPAISYSTHIQGIGWQSYKSNGAASGTIGQGKRLEGIKIKLSNKDVSGGIQYRTHVQSYGWQEWVSDDKLSGTSGQAKRLEAIQIKLTGEMANKYDVYYRVHAQNFGWMGWAKNGESAGTSGYSYRLEAIQVVLVGKGGSAPGRTDRPYEKAPTIRYSTHIQGIGWQDSRRNGATSGTIGQGKRLEGITIEVLDQDYSGSIHYRTLIQSDGWQDGVLNGQLSGTTGQTKRLEAISMVLSAEMSNQFDVYYRVHSQNFGWMGWAKNGESAGTSGYSYRLEAVQVKLVKKGTAFSEYGKKVSFAYPDDGLWHLDASGLLNGDGVYNEYYWWGHFVGGKKAMETIPN